MCVPPAAAKREIDVVFTGNMRYPPNRRAALWLDREIAREIWRHRPGARIVVAGRAAATLRLRHTEAMSDVPSIPDVLARSRVAIVPLDGSGTGSPTKALEAAVCGAALVVTPWVNERVDLPAQVAADGPGLAAAAASLLSDEEARAALAAHASDVMQQRTVGAMRAQFEDAVMAAVSDSRGPAT
jgi:hypothetical protein